jgi:sugar fermentation stimulation protein A
MKINSHTGDDYDLKWPRLIRGTLIKRYQRFKADVKLRNGHIVTAHCPNSGSMLTCSDPGRPVYLSRHNNPKRRLKYTWEMTEMPTSLVGVNTWVPNLLSKKWVMDQKLEELVGYEQVRSEVKYGQNSRIDLLLEKGDERCFVEVKNCTLVEDDTAYFPDAVTSRGLKHLVELQQQVREGHRAVMLYLIQRMDAKQFSPAHHIDPDYGKELRRAARNGIEISVCDVFLNLEGISLNKRLPYEL